jgi:hypothetical protein
MKANYTVYLALSVDEENKEYSIVVPSRYLNFGMPVRLKHHDIDLNHDNLPDLLSNLQKLIEADDLLTGLRSDVSTEVIVQGLLSKLLEQDLEVGIESAEVKAYYSNDENNPGPRLRYTLELSE